MEHKQKFSLNLIFLLALNLLVKPFYLFGVEVGVQNAVGANEYGLYYAMFNFTFLFNVLLDLGVNNFQKVTVAQDERQGLGNMSVLFPMKVLLSVFYMLVTVATAWALGFEGRYWFFIGWLMLNHILSVFLLMLRANLSGMHMFVRDSLLSVTDRLILIVGVSYALWFRSEPFSIETFVLFQTAAYACAVVAALFLSPKGKRWFGFNYSWSDMLDMAKKTWPFALLILLMTAYNRLDGVMLERLATEGELEAGIYAQAFRILDAGNSFAFLYAGILLPLFARMLHSKEQSGLAINDLVNQAARMLIGPAGVVCILAFFYGEWVMSALYVEHAAASAKCLKWLMGSFVFVATGYVFGTLITAGANLKWLNRLALLTVLLNGIGNIILIPTHGAQGVAFTSFVSLGFMALGQVFFARRHFSVGIRPWLVKCTMLWLITLIFVGVAQWLDLTPWVSLLSIGGLSATFFVVFVVDLRELIRTRAAA
jgi:O-antigen/teichoic acid export membrane protein